MKKLMLIMVALLTGASFISADTTVDSLKAALNDADGVEKAVLLNDVAHQYLLVGSMDLDKAARYSEDALNTARRLQLIDEEAEALSNLGQVMYYRERYEESIEYQRRALDILNHDKGKSLTGYCLSRIGHALNRLGRTDEMYDYMRDAHAIFTALSDQKPASYVSNYLGLAYWKIGEYDSALVYFIDALEIREKLTDYRETAKTLNNIGTVYYQRGNYPEAVKYFLLSLKINERIGNLRGVSLTESNIGRAYLFRGKYDNAFNHCRQSMKSGFECGHNDVLGYVLNTVGDVHSALAHHDSALAYYRWSLGYYREDNNDAGIILSRNSIAKTMNDMGCHEEALSIAQEAFLAAEGLNSPEYLASSLAVVGEAYLAMGKTGQALEAVERGLEYTLRAGLHEKTKDAYGQLSDIYRRMGNSEKALDYHLKHASLKDSLLNERMAWNMDRLRITYETEKKERDIEKLRLEKQVNEALIDRNRTVILFTTVSFFLCACIAVMLFLKNRRKRTVNRLLEDINAELSEQRDEILRKNSELEDAVSKIKVLSGLVPICAHCKKIRDDEGYWNQLETYITEHSDARFTHGICPECRDKVFGEYLDKGAGNREGSRQ